MPTSSQALILIKTDSGRLSSFYKTRVTPEITPFPVSKVNLTGVVEARGPNGSRTLLKSTQSEPFKQSKPLEGLTVNGYRGVLSFDPTLRSFRWQLMPDPVGPKLIRPKHHQNVRADPSSDPEDHHVHEEVVLTSIDDQPASNVSEENYRRLLDLGFRTSSFRGLDGVVSPEPRDEGRASPDHRKTPSPRPKSSLSHLREQRPKSSRHMSAPNVAITTYPSRMEPEATSKSERHLEPAISPSDEKTFLEDVKTPRRRKKVKLPTLRLRKELPPPSPQQMCFCLKKMRSFSHEEVKAIVERQLGTGIGMLRFDPVYVHLGVDNTDGQCMWVFSVKDERLRTVLLKEGLVFEGQCVRVRRYDDVMREENEAYRLYRSIEDEKKRRGLTPAQRRSSQTAESPRQLERHVAFTVCA